MGTGRKNSNQRDQDQGFNEHRGKGMQDQCLTPLPLQQGHYGPGQATAGIRDTQKGMKWGSPGGQALLNQNQLHDGGRSNNDACQAAPQDRRQDGPVYEHGSTWTFHG